MASLGSLAWRPFRDVEPPKPETHAKSWTLGPYGDRFEALPSRGLAFCPTARGYGTPARPFLAHEHFIAEARERLRGLDCNIGGSDCLPRPSATSSKRPHEHSELTSGECILELLELVSRMFALERPPLDSVMVASGLGTVAAGPIAFGFGPSDLTLSPLAPFAFALGPTGWYFGK